MLDHADAYCEIVEQGTHESFLAQKGLYEKLWSLQKSKREDALTEYWFFGSVF